MNSLKLYALGVGLVLVLAAGGAGASYGPSPAETPAPATRGLTTLMVAKNDALGNILVDSKGMTLYIYTKDAPNTSNCSGGCATAWPPLTLPAGATLTAGPGASATLAVIRRDDGTSQVTIDGKPLYYYAGDAKPGDTIAQGANDMWYVVQPGTTP